MKIDFVGCASRSGLFQFALEAVREKVHLHSHLIVSAAFHVDLLADREIEVPSSVPRGTLVVADEFEDLVNFVLHQSCPLSSVIVLMASDFVQEGIRFCWLLETLLSQATIESVLVLDLEKDRIYNERYLKSIFNFAKQEILIYRQPAAG